MVVKITLALALTMLFSLSGNAQISTRSSEELTDSLSVRRLELKKKYLRDRMTDSAYLAKAKAHFDSVITAFRKADESLYGRTLPNASLQTVDGSFFEIDSLRGKPSILFFWTVTCQPCLDKIPMIMQLRDEYGPMINIVALTSNQAEEAFNYLDLHDFDVVNLVDAYDYGKEIGVKALPKILVVDRVLTVQGVLGKAMSGLDSASFPLRIRALIDQL